MVAGGRGDPRAAYTNRFRQRGRVDLLPKKGTNYLGRVDLPAKVKEEHVLTVRLQVAYGCGGSRRSSSGVHE